MSLIDIEETPEFKNGYYWGSKLCTNIENSIYKNLETALYAKEVLLKNLTEEVGWNDENEKVRDLKGFIKAIKDRI